MFLVDVYELKQDVTSVLLRNIFDNFQNMFESQCERHEIPTLKQLTPVVKKVSSDVEEDSEKDEDEECSDDEDYDYEDELDGDFVKGDFDELYWKHVHERCLLASAWYAIVFESSASYNGQPLRALPWMIAYEMVRLSKYYLYRKNQETFYKFMPSSDEKTTPELKTLPKQLWCTAIHPEKITITVDACLDTFTTEANMDLVLDSVHYRSFRQLVVSWFFLVGSAYYSRSQKDMEEKNLCFQKDVHDGDSCNLLSESDLIKRFIEVC